MTRRAWGRVALVVLVVALPLGRWVALRTAGRAWAESLGVAVTHAAIVNLRLALIALAFTTAAAWAVGNLYLLYRSIGSVHVPRRLGNIEILEAVPRKYLQFIMLGLGGAVAAVLSVGARDWWMAFALAGATTGAEAQEPVLRREVGYYLFTLPWQHRVLGFLTRLVSIVFLLTAGLHALIGAVRWTGRRIETTDLARTHLAVQLAVLAALLFLNFRLDPSEYVSGLKDVPYDAILIDVRFPVAALLSGLALAAGVTSLAWIRVPRAAVAVVPWAALALVGVTGTYIVPGFAAAARSPEQRVRHDLVEAQRNLLGYAYGAGTATEVVTVPDVADPIVVSRRGSAVATVPLWDPPILQAILTGVGTTAGDERWTEPVLGVYQDHGGTPVPTFVAVRERDLLARRAADPDLSWHDAHSGRAAFGTGAAAVRANVVSATGLPLFVPNLTAPDSATSHVTDLALQSQRIAFSPAAEAFAVLDSTEASPRVVGLRIRGVSLRLALAWALQSPQFLSSRAVASGGLLLWPRGIAERLERLAPFASFGAPYPVVANNRLQWLAAGYVHAEAFPLSIATDFAGRRVRYARAGFIGVVDAHDGSTALYLLPQPDPLSAAWAELAADIIRPAERLPLELVRHVRYPEALLAVQAPLVLRGGAAGLPSLPRRPPSESPRTMWLPGSATDGPSQAVMIHATATGESGAVEAVVQGVMDRGVPRLSVHRLREPVTLGLAPVLEGTVVGRVRALVFPEGVVGVVPSYEVGAAGTDLPRFREVTVESGEISGRGRSYAEALVQLRSVMAAPPATGAQWSEARRWFGRLDQARRAGDWVEFGRAWQELQRLLSVPRDTVP